MEAAGPSQDYSESDWCREMLVVAKGPRLRCPECGSPANYQPHAVERDDGSTRLYRGCKRCGFWQDVGESPYRCYLAMHLCQGTPQARPIPVGETWNCEDCEAHISQQHAVPWPRTGRWDLTG